MSAKDDSAPCPRPDWRDAESYRHLLDLDRAGWAWDWLRRNPDYVRERQNHGASVRDLKSGLDVIRLSPGPSDDAQRWGLCFR